MSMQYNLEYPQIVTGTEPGTEAIKNKEGEQNGYKFIYANPNNKFVHHFLKTFCQDWHNA